MKAARKHGIAFGLVVAAFLAVLPAASFASADEEDSIGPYSGGPTHYFTSSDGDEIALSVVLPDGYKKGKRYPTILEMAGYENGSASSDGRTMIGQTKDFLCGFRIAGTVPRGGAAARRRQPPRDLGFPLRQGLRDRPRQPARHGMLVGRVLALQPATTPKPEPN